LRASYYFPAAFRDGALRPRHEYRSRREYNPLVQSSGVTLWREIARSARAAICVLAIAALAGCTPEQHLLLSLIPDGTFPVLLSHLEKTDDANRRRVAELDARGDWKGLVQLADKNLAQDRFNSDWWMVKGYAYTQLGQHEQAAECYEEMVRLRPDNMLGWNLLAQSQRAARQPQRAAQTLNNALLIRRDSPATWFLLGESYTDLGNYRPATQAYRQAVRLNREFSQAWYGLGRSYARQGRHAEFEQIVQTLTRLDPPLAQQLANERPGPEAPRTP
jgi:tetratricopeptide (TPR) repeat protein